MLFSSRGAETVPLYAARQGLECQACHFDPNGGGPRNAFGFLYARNRHSIVPEAGGVPGELANRVGENMPVFLGVNQRFMMLSNSIRPKDGPDRFGFFNMENALHIAFQPHDRLTLSYTRDGFDDLSTVKDAYGMIGGFPWNGYLRAGRFRNPFGLRMDDHTVGTRNSFLEFAGGPVVRPPRFLPYDPRGTDAGIEIGMSEGILFGRAAFTNGGANVLRPAGDYAETKTVKLGANLPWYQAGASFYDSYHKVPLVGVKRATRWGYYGLAHTGPVAFVGEIAAGTDEAEPPVGRATGAKKNLLAVFAEVDYTPVRWLNLRLRYDRVQFDRSTDPVVRDRNTHDRYAFETEYVPVAFAELRGTLRRIEHQSDVLRNETQGYVQFHFSY